MLQWGRTLSSAEWRVRTRPPHFPDQLQWGRTLSSAECSGVTIGEGARIEAASMGPHSIECGMCSRVSNFSFILKLQWGRTLSSAEWGAPGTISPMRRGLGFNGAALYRV